MWERGVLDIFQVAPLVLTNAFEVRVAYDGRRVTKHNGRRVLRGKRLAFRREFAITNIRARCFVPIRSGVDVAVILHSAPLCSTFNRSLYRAF